MDSPLLQFTVLRIGHKCTHRRCHWYGSSPTQQNISSHCQLGPADDSCTAGNCLPWRHLLTDYEPLWKWWKLLGEGTWIFLWWLLWQPRHQKFCRQFQGICNNCDKQGHMARNCWAPEGGAARGRGQGGPLSYNRTIGQNRGGLSWARGQQWLVPETHHIATRTEGVMISDDEYVEYQRWHAMTNTMPDFWSESPGKAHLSTLKLMEKRSRWPCPCHHPTFWFLSQWIRDDRCTQKP